MLPRPLAIALAVSGLAACTASPTVRGFAGQKGLANADAGAARCPVAPTPPNRGRSAGCGKVPAQPVGQYAEHALTVDCEADNARDRLYYVRLPPGYDPNKAYRTVYLGPGCGPPQDLVGITKAYPMESAADPDAILIAMEQGFYNKAEYNSANCVDPNILDGGTSSNLCHYCFDDGAGTPDPDSVEYGYFDRLHKAVEEDFCVDTDRQFFAGYSSGGWMAHQLGCQFPDVLRAQGSVTGGLPFAIHSGAKSCVDHPIAAFLIHDAMDTSNVYAGSVSALERLLAMNGCTGGWTMSTAPKEPYTIVGVPNNADLDCVRYTGCPAAYPIVFCTSRGKAHDAQTSTAVPGFWQFFKSL
jgi:poly(3-hydroxybutyrate) depolymerase